MVEDICTHVLILTEGKQRFFGPLDEVHQAFASDVQTTSATLEEVFFRATELLESASH